MPQPIRIGPRRGAGSASDQLPIRPDLLELFDISELEKYFTDDELAEHPSRAT